MGQASDRWMGYGVGRPVQPGEVLDFTSREWRDIVSRLDLLLCAITGEGPEVVRHHEEEIAEWRYAMRAFIIVEAEHHFQNFERAFALYHSESHIPAELAVGMLNALGRRNRDGPKLNAREAALFQFLADTSRLAHTTGLADRALAARVQQGQAFNAVAEKAARGVPLNESEAELYRYGLRVFVSRRRDEIKSRGETFVAKGSRHALDVNQDGAKAGDYGRRADGSRNLWVVKFVRGPIDDAGGRYFHAGLLASRVAGNLVEAEEIARTFVAAHKGEWRRGGEIWIEPGAFSASSMPGAKLIRWNQLGGGPSGL